MVLLLNNCFLSSRQTFAPPENLSTCGRPILYKSASSVLRLQRPSTATHREEMKPDGVVTAALEPVETLESNPLNEAAPQPAGGVQEPNQATDAVEGETPQQSAEVVIAQPDQTKDTAAAKMSSKASGERKASPSSKALLKSKPNISATGKSASAPGKTPSSMRPGATQSRMSNGTSSKPPTNGVLSKKAPAAGAAASAAVKKSSTPAAAATKTATSSTGAPASRTKVGEKKPPSAANGAKMTGTTAATKSPSTGGSTAAKKPPGWWKASVVTFLHMGVHNNKIT